MIHQTQDNTEQEETVTYTDIQIKAIKGLCSELSDSMYRTEAERDLQKEAVAAISKEFEIPKAMLKKMARIYHKSKFSTVQEENKELEQTYLAVFGEKAL